MIETSATACQIALSPALSRPGEGVSHSLRLQMTPRVSIALPVYNGEPYLAQTLADLRRQSFEDWELVACDNASTDSTPALLADAAREDGRIRVVRNGRNLGAIPNTNRALSLTRAPLVNLWGHDDRHHPDFLAELIRAMDAHPDATLAYPDSTLVGPDDQPYAWDAPRRRFVDADGNVYGFDRGLERELPADPVAQFRAVLGSDDVNAPIHGVFRREALMRTLPFTIHGSDRLVVSHAALLGRFVHVPRPLFGFRMHPQSTYFLETDEWASRETGGAQTSRSGALTLARYAEAPLDADLSLRQRAAGVAAALGYAARRGSGAARRILAVNQEEGHAGASPPRKPDPDWSWLADETATV